MNPKLFETMAQDRIAEMTRSAAGDQRLVRAANEWGRTPARRHRAWIWRARRPNFLKVARLIASLLGGQ